MTRFIRRHLPCLVVDASVALKWALDDEDEVHRATSLRDDGLRGSFQMIAPSLWRYEVANGLVTAVRRGRLAADLGVEVMAALGGLDIVLTDPEIRDCYSLALRHQVAIYDAAYLALARELNAELWTGDRKFLMAVRSEAPFVRWIGEYEPR